MSLMDAAIAYAAKGIAVFPCREKMPLTKHGFKDASTDPDQIRAWWTKWPNAWIAIPTGKASGFDVLDLDSKKGKNGFDHVAEWEHLTPIIAMTPSGGAHLYFRSDGVRCTQGKIAKGVDTRGDGGYVIVPPSPGYRWRNGGIL